MRNILLWGAQSKRLRETLPRYRFFRNAVTRFMPGENLEDGLEAAERLRDNGIASVLTYLGENVTTKSEAEQVTSHYLDVLERVSTQRLDCHISTKLTQLGLDFDKELTYANLMTIVKRASTLRTFVWIDMEGSAYTDVTLELFQRARSEHPNVGVCLQSYLYRTGRDLQSLLRLSPSIRMVKGAYAEPRDVAFHKKKDVDANFHALSVELLRQAQRNGSTPAFATHDLELIRRVQEEASAIGVSRNQAEFQMLYGIRRREQLQLARDGYRVRILISYGTMWFPWYMRRLAERPSNVLFVLRTLFNR